ncbi:hypothetical protein SDC9_159765 [bioreactor metagenome]|uniref:Uncharacterized protein n=1 Tax=bioreactor metagenome TaxID=1076179 RepID=A0A645FDR2_9ZZZZ
MGHIQTQLGQQVVGVLELFLGLAGEAYNDIGGNRNAGDAFADLVHQLAVLIGRIATAHVF